MTIAELHTDNVDAPAEAPAQATERSLRLVRDTEAAAARYDAAITRHIRRIWLGAACDLFIIAASLTTVICGLLALRGGL